MKKTLHLLSAALLLLLSVFLLAACGEDKPESLTETDYAAEIKLDMTSATLKQEVTVKTFIDGDTTHFNVPESVSSSGVLNARYLAVNTPESTGKIEEYGKKASAFTKEKLSDASEILIESDDGSWNRDSTGERVLVWVWYKPSSDAEWRNLNVELLQNGLAIASSSANNRYGETCVAAIAQAKRQTLNVYSGSPDPDFYYGEAVELTLKELRCNTGDYNGVKVAFEGVITVNDGNSVLIEEYDAETDMYYGITVYYGYNLSGEGLDVLAVGNRSRIVGTVQYYEAGGTYQISGLSYRLMKPDDPNNIMKLGEGYSPAYIQTSPEVFAKGKVAVDNGEGTSEFTYAELAMNTSIVMDDLLVESIYTTDNADSSSFGAMTLTCSSGGEKITIRTAVLRDSSGELVTEEYFRDKTISVRGFIDYFSGEYQIKVFTIDAITIK